MAIEKYCTAAAAAYLRSQEANMFVKTTQKLAWGVHRACRTYLVQEVLAPHVPPIRAGLLSRFHSFFQSLLASPSHKVAVVAQMAAWDARSSLGSNLGLLTERTGGGSMGGHPQGHPDSLVEN